MKLKIDNEAIAQEFFSDVILYGIVAPIKDYHLVWHLNQMLNFKFRLNNDIEIQLTKKQRQYFFAVYEYPVPALTVTHYLYNNQHDGEYLLPEFKHLDFLWIIKGEGFDAEAIKLIEQSFKKIPSVQLVIEMTNEKIKNKQHLIL
jgi:hypothetical protein